MEIGNNKIETIDGKMLWIPTIPTIPADVDIPTKLDELLGKPTLIEELTKLVIKDEQERYIRELLIRNKELKEKLEMYKTVMRNQSNMSYGLTGADAKLYKHRLDTANEYIESRKEHMIPDHYNDLKYILNECDLESSW